MQKRTFTGLALAVMTASVASAQNDECATATAAALGAVPFDTTAATLSAEIWPCGNAGANGLGPDIWYTYTSTVNSANTLRIETCGSSYDTILEVFTGSCGALTPLICNDDGCSIPGFHSGLEIAMPPMGTTYTFRIGGYNGTSGTGTLTLSEIVPPPGPPANCVETLFASNNGGAAGGAVYFDLTVGASTTFTGIMTNYAAAGLPVGIEVYTAVGSYAGQEIDPTAWTLVATDDGTAIGEAEDTPSVISFASAWTAAPGTMGIALVAIGAGHEYTNGVGGDQYVSGDGNLTLDLGTASNVPFTGGIFSPRVWNGRLCASGPVPLGTPYCVTVANSTGNTGSMSALGSNTAADNDVTLTASDLPANQFGIFVTSQTQGFVPMAGGSSNGNLCLGGTLGRFVGPMQILSSGAAGEFSLAVNTMMVPEGPAFVAIAAGETWNFQAWFRDGVGLGSNFTNGLEIGFN